MHKSIVSPYQALQQLKDGNHRYAVANAQHPNQSFKRRVEVLEGQHPFAIILSCSDSRVPPEIIFDQGIGDLFIIRNAGNIVDDVVLGSIEYAAEHLGVPLVLVLGHTQCGAVTAAVKGGAEAGHIAGVIQTIQPAVAASKNQPGDAVLNAALENVRMTVAKIKTCEPILTELIKKGDLIVSGGLYHLDTGNVDML